MAQGRVAREASSRSGAPSRVGGFSLIEMAVVVVILGLLLGGLLAPLAAQQDAQKTAETRRLLEEVREGLLGFAAVQGRLPCPDRLADGDGLEDPRVEGADPPEDGCAGGEYGGWVPWVTLGVSPRDAWGRRLRYRVTRELTRRVGDPSAAACVTPASAPGAASAAAAASFSAAAPRNPCVLELGDPGDISVHGRDLATRAERLVARELAAVVLSLGPNGLGGVDAAGAPLSAPPAGAEDELRNLDLDATFVARDRSAPTPGCRDSAAAAPPCEFDDLLLWVSPHVLYNRLVIAGRLP
jgi:prepilin-type N-terminal cleavage/methylation domain-containing protein